jgi:hypothetical protein
VVDVLTFEVSRAWKLFSCDGAPCCPNEWLLETDSGEFVQLDSWSELRPTDDGDFPGRHVVATRPRSERLLHALTTGAAVPSVPFSPEALLDLADQYCGCRIIHRDQLLARILSDGGGQA